MQEVHFKRHWHSIFEYAISLYICFCTINTNGSHVASSHGFSLLLNLLLDISSLIFRTNENVYFQFYVIFSVPNFTFSYWNSLCAFTCTKFFLRLSMMGKFGRRSTNGICCTLYKILMCWNNSEHRFRILLLNSF